ncbi:peptide deformylase, partial [Candidatus Gottesmanbacteria bacterium]|nr:peptide deformylase [Candidatus Gottesmanbacteria bacterium]
MIITVPNKVLTTPAKTVEKIDKKIRQIIAQMKKDLLNKENPKGVGLAATQIGVSLRIFITKPTDDAPIDVFINPEIIAKSKEMVE